LILTNFSFHPLPGGTPFVPGPSLRQTAAPPVDDALAKLRQAAQSAIDSVTMSMLGGRCV